MPLYAQTDQPQPALYQAMAKNDIAKAKAAINSGEDVNAIYGPGYPAAGRSEKSVRKSPKLIMQSPKVAIDKRGFWYDDFDEWERTPLILAAHMGQTEMVTVC